MIGWISGRLAYCAGDRALIDVNGVGYVVHCSEWTLRSLPAAGEQVSLHTELLVREDLLQLFGFSTLQEKEWHRLLTGVQGVGAKASLAMLGALGPDGLARAISLEDWSAVASAKGIGPKTAQRVVNELRDKVPEMMAMDTVEDPIGASGQESEDAKQKTPRTKAAPPPKAGKSAARSEALSALANLGYAPGQAASAVARAMEESPDSDTAALIRESLRLLAPKE